MYMPKSFIFMYFVTIIAHFTLRMVPIYSILSSATQQKKRHIQEKRQIFAEKI